ncbi:MAG: primosomal protein N' [Acidobacteria bacterium]|nr:primosomal protein N' [Acidobacteriota bacterium]
MIAVLEKEQPSPRFVEVALPLPPRRTFTYRIPEHLAEIAKPGSRALVPFGKRRMTGYIVAVLDRHEEDFEIELSSIRDVIEVIDHSPMITPEILRLTRWTAGYYAGSWGEILKAALPAGINTMAELTYSITALGKSELQRSVNAKPLKTQILHRIAEENFVSRDVLEKEFGRTRVIRVLREFESAGKIAASYRESAPVVKPRLRKVVELANGNGESETKRLTAAHKKVIDVLASAGGRLLFGELLNTAGVSGSSVNTLAKHGRLKIELEKSALMLVPEIALTPIFSQRLRAVFGDEVAILHSNLSSGERFDEWRRIRRGDARIVIGTRSAVFAPLGNLGLVIVDEEHDSSYRQSESPFYHARDVAIVRAQQAGAIAVVGSATPALESFYNSQTGKYRYLGLQYRIENRPMAQAELIDMRAVFRRAGKDVVCSPALIEAIENTHSRGEQSIILLNRRGFSSFVLCRTCGESLCCKNCDITLTYHKSSRKVTCHYCGFSTRTPETCPFCKSEFLYFIGQGTEQLEEIIARRFSNLRVARIDRDTITKKGQLAKILNGFDRGEIDMLVGTQMLAKGHDFHNVTLVGVVSVDIGLGLPDFRSAERTFQLITQVAGRAGRGILPGRVLIQTYYPEHYALRHACRQDYEGFYNDELRFRERMGYPPIVVLASILVKHSDQEQAIRTASALKVLLLRAEVSKQCRILGPASASLPRLKGEYRYQILIKSQNRKDLRSVIDSAINSFEEGGGNLRSVFVEMDPIDLM